MPLAPSKIDQMLSNISAPKHARVYFVRVRGFPERRMQVPMRGTGQGFNSDAGFVLVVLVVVFVVVLVPPLGSHVFGKDLHSA